MRYIIIGGGVAGTSAAEIIRQHDDTGEVVLISDEPYPLYSRVMLSKPSFFLGKVMFDSIFKKDIGWYKKQRIDFKQGVKAEAIDVNKKQVVTDTGETIVYEKLLLAIGGAPRALRVPGEKLQGVYSVRTLDDAKNIIKKIKLHKPVLVVGGGFISFEMCDILKQAGMDVTLLVREDFFWENCMNQKAGSMLESAMKHAGITIIKQETVAEIDGIHGEVVAVETNKARQIATQMVIVGVGVAINPPRLIAGELKQNRGIMVNEYLETSAHDIWAAGDCAEYYDVILKEHTQMGMWVTAQMQGRTAGLNMVGKREEYRFIASYMCSGFGLSIAFVGDVRAGKGKEIKEEIDNEAHSYARFISKNGALIGAVLINRMQDVAWVTESIKSSEDVSLVLKNVV